MDFIETSVAAIFQNQAAKYGDRACVAYKHEGSYTNISWNDMNTMVRGIGAYLLSLGVKKGEKIAVFSPNRYEWWVADLAILSIGAVNVPIYATNSAEEALYVLNHSDSRLCFVGTADHLEKVQKIRKKLKKLQSVVIFDNPEKKSAGVVTFGDALKSGALYNNKSLFDKRLTAIKPDDLATIIYTSGTTGDPKGVMLSHNNFVSDVNQIITDFRGRFSDDDVLLSFLPLSHSFERTVGYYLPIAAGGTVAFAEDFSTIQENLQEIRPTVIVSVPRLYEKIHAGVLSRVSDVTGIKRKLFDGALKTASKNLPYICREIPRKGFFKLRYNFFDRLIFSKLREALGLDRIKLAVSGGGPLSVTDAEFFLGMGILVLEGFGLTETTPVTNVNRPGQVRPGTVGSPLADTTVKISDEGEILIKGPQVMLGYYKNKDATREVFTKDGFFKTGDIGSIDEKNRLSITGRIKDIIVTAGGKNISPQNIENSLKGSKFIEQVAIIGDRRKFLSALIIPVFDELKKWAKSKKISFSNNSELISNELVVGLIAEEIDKYTKRFSRVEQIRKFKLLDAEWTQATEELTPTLKIKRAVVEKKYAREIESMYME